MQAWEDFKKVYFEGSGGARGQDLRRITRLPIPLSYEIYLNDVSMQDALVTYLQVIRRRPRRSSSQKSRQIHCPILISLIGYISVGHHHDLTCGLPSFLISNTVTIGISVRKEEIAYHETDRSDGLILSGHRLWWKEF